MSTRFTVVEYADKYLDKALSPVSRATRSVFDRYGNYFERWFGIVDQAELAIWKISKVILAIMVLIVTFQVITRYVFNWIPQWGGELTRAMAIWASLLMMSALIWRDKHLQVEFVFQTLPLRLRRRIRSLQLMFIGVFAVFYTYYGWQYAIGAGFRSSSTSMHHLLRNIPGFPPGFRLDMFWIYIILPISGVLLIIAVVSKIIQINYYPDQLEEDYSERYGAVEVEEQTVDAEGDN